MINRTLHRSLVFSIALLGCISICFGQNDNSADRAGAIQLQQNQVLDFSTFQNGGGADKDEIAAIKAQINLQGNPVERNTVWFKLPAYEVSTAVSFLIEDHSCGDDLDVILVNDEGQVLAAEMTGGSIGESRGQDNRCRWQFQGGLEGQVYALIHNYTSTSGFNLEIASESASDNTEVLLGEGDIKIWPNPARAQLFVEAQTTKGSIALIDVSGKVCASSNSIQNLSIQNCASGILLLNVRMEDGEYSTQILKI